jgi:chromosome segregation ATPase
MSVALLLAVACGGPDDLAASARDEIAAAVDAAQEAQDVASAAADHAADLEKRMERVRVELEHAEDARSRMVARLATLRERLWASISSLRTGLGDARSMSGAAAAEADDALARAGQVARDLSVLQQRYDYHLRRYHGGG